MVSGLLFGGGSLQPAPEKMLKGMVGTRGVKASLGAALAPKANVERSARMENCILVEIRFENEFRDVSVQ